MLDATTIADELLEAGRSRTRPPLDCPVSDVGAPANY
jgi:hypothetical protein